MTTPRPQNGLTIAEMVRLYVEEHLTTGQIADIAGMSSGTVWSRLRDAGVTFRQRGNPPKLDPEDLRRWYVDEGQSTLEIAKRTGMSTSGVTAAMERAGIARRPLEAAELPIDDDQLARLYVDERLDDDDIASTYGVAPWTVRRRLRAAGIRRPNGAPPGGDVPMPTADELRRHYNTEGQTLAQIAAHYGVPQPTVRRWLEIAHIPRRARPASSGQRPDESPQLTRAALWDSYVTQGRTAAEIAAELGVTKNIVITALHAQRIPVRPSGPSTREPIVLLDALYSDPDVRAVLNRHHIPIRPQAGALRERWPSSAELDEDTLRELYLDIGLSAAQISLLTGVDVAGVRHRLQRAGLNARPPGRAPWTAYRSRW